MEERKAAIYENLRDLNFEFRLGKLSDADYEKSKQSLEKQLAKVNSEIASLTGKVRPAAPAEKPAATKATEVKVIHKCPSCGAEFDRAMKFCGECAAPMGDVKS